MDTGSRWPSTTANTESSISLPLREKGVFAAWNDPEVFRAVQVGPFGELAWGDEIDLCPDSLYLEATGKNPEDVFPALKSDTVHA
jgi:hypothetical protein